MDNIFFTPLEETISFYTRNDFAIINRFLAGNFDALWKDALIAYEDNRGILEEYEKGIRSADSDYDIKWQTSLKKRLIHHLDDAAKERIIKNAENDISNILEAVYPSKRDMLLYRTAWIDREHAVKNSFPYSREYKALSFETGSVFEIKTISSYSLTPYREDDDVGSGFFRYEMRVPRGMPVLELDSFVTHNEEGEVLLPPMVCKVVDIRFSEHRACKGIIELEYVKPLKEAGGGIDDGEKG